MEVERRKDGVQTSSRISPTSSSSSLSTRWQATIPTPCERTKVVQRYPQSVSLLPISWDIILSIYRELVRLINRLPFKKKLIVCIVFKGSKFRFDLGEVKAAGVVCLIGLGLSLGTLLLYRLYFRIIVPFLHNVWAAKGKNSLIDDEYTLYLESDSEVDDKMGNSHSKKSVPSVYYSPGYGVALGSRPSSIDVDSESIINSKGVQLRARKSGQLRTKSPSPASDKDSAIGVGGSEMSQSYYSEISTNRDSFYSTCTVESGFDDFGFLEDLKNSKLSSSLKENCSPNSLIERNLQMLYRAHHGYDAGLNSIGRSAKPGLETLSDCSSERSGILSSRSCRSSCDGDSYRNVSARTNIDPLVEKLVSEHNNGLRTTSRTSQNSFSKGLPHSRHSEGLTDMSNILITPQADAELVSSPKRMSGESQHRHRTSQHRGRGNSPFYTIQHQQQSHNRQSDWSCADDPNIDYDPSLDVSESIRSFNSSADEIDWDCEDDSRDRMSAVPHFQQSLSDLQFKQSLMQRIHEWSSFAEEYNKSRSPTPDCYPVKFVRRSRSLDRHLGDPSLILVSDPADTKPIEIEPTVEKNLESLEYELHDIQGEFESITSKLHELIEQGSGDQAALQSSRQLNSALSRGQRATSAPRTIDAKQLIKMRTQWDHVSSSACSDSSRSSRASSVEYAWDLGDYRNNLSAIAAGDKPRAGSRNEGIEPVHPAIRGLLPDETLNHTSHGTGTLNIGFPVAIVDYAEQEWRGNTDKCQTIREGYSRIPHLLSCHRICVIRGDNYCGLRSVIFQILVNGLRANQGWSGVIRIMDSLHDLYNDPSSGLSEWTFANRLPNHCKDRLASLSKCALTLYATIEEVCNLHLREERESRTIGLFNSSSTFDLELMEGLKIMMLLTLVGLKRQKDVGENLPLFGHLLFARDTSQTVGEFLRNHLNCVGDTGGLEQVEMCLLGYTLGVKIRVLQLSQCGQADFECFFPDNVPADWPEVNLIVEDSRHYNVPLP